MPGGVGVPLVFSVAKTGALLARGAAADLSASGRTEEFAFCQGELLFGQVASF